MFEIATSLVVACSGGDQAALTRHVFAGLEPQVTVSVVDTRTNLAPSTSDPGWTLTCSDRDAFEAGIRLRYRL